MNRLIDLTGKRFGRLTVSNKIDSPDVRTKWLCKCDCGGEKIARTDHLRNGRTSSCGCYKIELQTKHDNASRSGRTSEYGIWNQMIQRCHNPKNKGFQKWYGKFGIRVCERWRNSFEAFIEDMGRRPSSEHSIDRINPNGNYEPGNCRWATWKEQAINKRPRISKELDVGT